MLILILLTFVVTAVAIASVFFRPATSKIKERVVRLQAVPEELRGELSPEILADEKQSLLSKVDMAPVINRLTGSRAFMQNLEEDLARADIPLKPSEFLIMQLVIYLIVSLGAGLFLNNVIFGFGCALPLFIFHKPLLSVKKKMRITKFTNQLAEFLLLIVNSLRAGQTFMQGCAVAVKESPDPIAKEFKQLIKEVNLGMPEIEAMENLLRRVPSEDMNIVVSSYLIQRKVGGNLAEILETTAGTIRERIKIQGKINTLTTQGKLSGFIVGLLPFGLGGIISVLSPIYMKPLISHPIGFFMIGVALIMQVIGILVIRSIVSIDI
jgi:tight adherence protein B